MCIRDRFMDLLDSLQLNDKEQVAVNILMAGGAKGEIAKALNITNACLLYTSLANFIKSLFFPDRLYFSKK